MSANPDGWPEQPRIYRKHYNGPWMQITESAVPDGTIRILHKHYVRLLWGRDLIVARESGEPLHGFVAVGGPVDLDAILRAASR